MSDVGSGPPCRPDSRLTAPQMALMLSVTERMSVFGNMQQTEETRVKSATFIKSQHFCSMISQTACHEFLHLNEHPT